MCWFFGVVFFFFGGGGGGGGGGAAAGREWGVERLGPFLSLECRGTKDIQRNRTCKKKLKSGKKYAKYGKREMEGKRFAEGIGLWEGGGGREAETEETKRVEVRKDRDNTISNVSMLDLYRPPPSILLYYQWFLGLQGYASALEIPSNQP